MWIMVEPIAKILFGIRRSPMQCYGCNSCQTLRNHVEQAYEAHMKELEAEMAVFYFLIL
jgi:hypothetical protein